MRDNGQGFLPELDAASAGGSLGMSLIRNLAGQPDASLELYNDEGAACRLLFNPGKPEPASGQD